jgi:hypothetical protein
LDGLANLTSLTSLSLRRCKSVSPKPSTVDMTTRGQVAAYQEGIKKAME